MLKELIRILKLPENQQIKSLDDSENIYILRKIIQRKTFLRNIYLSFYRKFLNILSTLKVEGEVIELGSGAGFIKRKIPHVITSDVIAYEGIDKVFSALDIPFTDNSVSAFLMIDVLHHIKDSRLFFQEMQRCLKVGGKVVMIEPANTIWSRFIYTRFHHEPFDVNGGWGFEEGGPLSGANMAIPHIIFQRDVRQFIYEYPNLKICSISFHTPFRYLISGGLSFRQLLPSFTYPLIVFVEFILTPLNNFLGMFMTIELEKIS
ncbi:class I SAM-dependent methyltransferase [Pseudanabaena minima]|uniref:class I SAM-dependent methyltransferase n=1 Tax=Pseudanabaena minima TaxID=890415 RepID=UPI003DAA39B9